MEITTTPLPGVLLLRPKVFTDDRGYFLESYNASEFTAATGITEAFVQDNESSSAKGVLRGLHFQAPPHGQAKLVRVTSGAVLDVCIDLRADSPAYGRHLSIRIDARDKMMIYIPSGFAHGFLALEDHTVFLYKCSTHRVADAERTLLWNDPGLGIDWGLADPVISPKDREGLSLKSFPLR